MPGPQPTVVYVITNTGVAGAERQVYDLASTFKSRGWDVGVLSMRPVHEQFLPLRDEGVRLASLGMRKGVPDPRAIWRLKRLLREWRPDVVHAHQVHANLLARLSRPGTRVPRLISTIHNENEGRQWRYIAYRLTDRLADVTTAVSAVAADATVRRGGVPHGRIMVIPNGVDTRSFAPDPEIRQSKRAELGVGDQFVWLAVGRLTEAKAYPDLLQAFRLVRERQGRAVLAVAGEGHLEAQLKAQAGQLGLGDAISFLGLRSDIPQLMQAADAYVMSSLWEGLPIVLLEASASGLPMVATCVGGNAEVVTSESGRLVPAGEPSALADAMSGVMSLDAADLGAMGRAARDHVVRTFELDAVVDRWEALYRSLLSSQT